MEETPRFLKHHLHSKIEISPPPKESLLAIFDLDGTLLNYAARTKGILEHLCIQAEGNSSEDLRRIRELPLQGVRYYIEETLRENGLGDSELFDHFVEGWKRLFFSDDFLHFDTLVPGAVDFVREIYELGVTLIYLTGRDRENMFLGTVGSLYRHGFPIGVERTELLMKPKGEIDNREFKISVFDYLKRRGRVIGFFEDDADLLNLAAGYFPEAILVFVRGGQSPDSAALESGIFTVEDFTEIASRTITSGSGQPLAEELK